MTYEKFCRMVEKYIPGADIKTDGYGQLVIYTDKMLDWDTGKEVVPFVPGPTKKQQEARKNLVGDIVVSDEEAELIRKQWNNVV